MPNNLGLLRRNTLDPQTSQELDRLIPRMKSYVQQNTRIDDLADFVPWTDIPLVAAQFSAGQGPVRTWAVPNHYGNTFRYRVAGHTMSLKILLQGTTLGSLGAEYLTFSIPGRYQCARIDSQFIAAYKDAGPTWTTGALIQTPVVGGRTISIFYSPLGGTFSTGPVDVAASFDFEVL